tara:strand:- start:7677 stop:10730 length:3054 start_codon:yes stop_codon:yes gene_type:complete
MGFFHSVLQKHNLDRHDGRSLWQYNLTDFEVKKLQSILQNVDPNFMDSRDATLWISLWWQTHYNGGRMKKKVAAFDALGGSITHKIKSSDFFEIAKEGAERLQIDWIRQTKVLYLRTILLQGGLPIKHINENSSAYTTLLNAIISENITTIDEIKNNPRIYRYLPKSSQNDSIFQCCLNFIRDFLDSEDERPSSKLIQNESLSKGLSVQKLKFKQRIRAKKPTIYWTLDLVEKSIQLNFDFMDNYTFSNVSTNDDNYNARQELEDVLGFEPKAKAYPIYYEDKKIVEFVKNRKGDYKTITFHDANIKFSKGEIPKLFTFSNDEECSLDGLVQYYIDLSQPSLWIKSGKNTLKAVRGTGCNQDKAFVLAPNSFSCEKSFEILEMYEETLKLYSFEGALNFYKNNNCYLFQTKVASFDWYIQSNRPAWMSNTDQVVINGKPKVFVFDSSNNRIQNSDMEIDLKVKSSTSSWQSLSQISHLTRGCHELRLKFDNIYAYDSIYNIGNLDCSLEKSLTTSKASFSNANSFDIRLDEGVEYDILIKDDQFEIQLDAPCKKIPKKIWGRIKQGSQRSLRFALSTPFTGAALVAPNGERVEENTIVNIDNASGYRILANINCDFIISFSNRLQPDIATSKQLNREATPLMEFIEICMPLFFLGDLYDRNNEIKVIIISQQNRKLRFSFKLKQFTHTLYHAPEKIPYFTLFKSTEKLNLQAIPLNCKVEDIKPYPVFSENDTYQITPVENIHQWVIVSDEKAKQKLRPTYIETINIDHKLVPNERILQYHDKLLSESLEAECWQEFMAYFQLCKRFEIPFSTFDQIRAIQRTRECAMKAFFYLLSNDVKGAFAADDAIQLENELGFCFHWISANFWSDYFEKTLLVIGDNQPSFLASEVMCYFNASKCPKILNFIFNPQMNVEQLSNAILQSYSSELHERVLKELPKDSPFCSSHYDIPIEKHNRIEFLLKSALAAAESIKGTDDLNRNLWGYGVGNTKMRRYVQYAQSLQPELYEHVITYVLKQD